MHISNGNTHVCTINSKLEPNCWGLNTNGQTIIPENVSDNVIDISTGDGFTCAVKING